ncbi:MAG: sugar transferase [Tenericutes bacterium GWC2_34_14]|nr:MAG: sugar transferase [Tenericutes bacterium GWC2_34_14]OHE34475.1 MAG: sugar transferase [Tenericutes bacterium GWE2_34_108]OHE35831.1 MAG: sugar transferase [Tenericutes bacterium GWF1_35_14]OHE39082.1 MAG: sugar transferase [Tenericutes bacterium GWF2_35_184]OHE42851.1 MAG: sugar transferase [Tenericutes bacterium RIFOXYA2_FULL_36_32]OHE44031.1 MAG: sugar transferase [Tenericutes bacterium RIFOXYA12_FULL_35_10]OHE46079.1 MAG: sugar transferase [Tenericutes bacterium RIFOXYB2_FULL_36_25
MIYLIFKRLFDFIFAFISLVIILPLLLVIGLLVKFTSKGPVIFSQYRLGRGGKEFKILKFRTMIVNAEKVGDKLNTYTGDPRITKIGGILRNLSLDELPQLINILKGDMSFVGPRPPVTYHPYHYCDYPENFKIRFNVKPGVTGYAQVNGRNELNWEEKIKFDKYYVENISLFLDIYIVFKTVIVVFSRKGRFDKK